MNEVYNKLDELASKEVSRKKVLGFGLALAGTAMFGGLFGKTRKIVADDSISPDKEKRLTEIYKSITNIKK